LGASAAAGAGAGAGAASSFLPQPISTALATAVRAASFIRERLLRSVMETSLLGELVVTETVTKTKKDYAQG